MKNSVPSSKKLLLFFLFAILSFEQDYYVRLLPESYLCLPRLIEDGRIAFQEKYQKELGEIINIKQQVVSGMNYQVFFEMPNEKGKVHFGKITGYCCPWLDIR